MSIHYNKGNATNKIAFILSAPGKIEGETGRPASGKTGDNLNAILEILNKKKPLIFESIDRYQYVITNTTNEVIHSSKESGRTEDSNTNITEKNNIVRIQSEIENCSIIILCGKKAELLTEYLYDKILVKSPHPGNKGLRNKYKNNSTFLKGIEKPADREAARLRFCAECILEQLHNVNRTFQLDTN